MTLPNSYFDCRYVSNGMAELSGSHCPIDNPCQRCENDMKKAELEKMLKEAIELLSIFRTYNEYAIENEERKEADAIIKKFRDEYGEE